MSAIDPTEKKKRGCFFYGCISLLVCAFVVSVAGFLVVRYAVNKLNALIVEYSDTQPMVLPKVNMPANELRALEERVKAFNIAAGTHSNTPPLVLSSTDINALLSSTTNFSGMKDKFYFEIDGDRVQGELSLPMEKEFRVPLLHFKGRYLNGKGTFKVTLTNGALQVNVESFEVKGKPLPERFMAKLRISNLAQDFNDESPNSDVLNHYESIEVSGGKVTVKAKGQ